MSIRLYCCGGAGSNIGKLLAENTDIETCYIDTSVSNLRSVSRDHIYLVDDMDGAGKDRKKTYQGFTDTNAAEEILIQFKPASTINIVISSLSGGSGSIISPLLTRALIDGEHPVIVIGVDSCTSTKEILNTIDTLKSFNSISQKTKTNISLLYLENSSRARSDAQAKSFINYLSLICNKKLVDEFDTADLNNFINFNKVTDYQPSVSFLEVNPNKDIDVEKGINYVSTILVTSDTEEQLSLPTPDYLATCIVVNKETLYEGSYRIDNALGSITLKVDELTKKLEQIKETRVFKKTKALELDDSTDEGIVL